MKNSNKKIFSYSSFSNATGDANDLRARLLAAKLAIIDLDVKITANRAIYNHYNDLDRQAHQPGSAAVAEQAQRDLLPLVAAKVVQQAIIADLQPQVDAIDTAAAKKANEDPILVQQQANQQQLSLDAAANRAKNIKIVVIAGVGVALALVFATIFKTLHKS